MRLALLIVAILMSVPAQAETFTFWKDGQKWDMRMPADYWFDRPPLAPIKLLPQTAETVESDCELVTGKAGQFGCAAIVAPFYCDIIIDKDLPPDLYAATLRHEEAHCRGWPADHPMD